MDDYSKHIKLYEGSMVTLRALEHYLDKKKIPCYIKSFSESARLAGFGNIANNNELYIYDEDNETALAVLKTFLEE